MFVWTEYEQYFSVLHNKSSLRNGGKEIQALQGTGTLLLMGTTDQKNKTLTFRSYQGSTNAVIVCKLWQFICLLSCFVECWHLNPGVKSSSQTNRNYVCVRLAGVGTKAWPKPEHLEFLFLFQSEWHHHMHKCKSEVGAQARLRMSH